MEGDLIFVSVDPVFNIVLLALKELNDQRRLTLTNVQCSKLNGGIKSNDADDANQYIFGGIGATPNVRALAFGRTASSVIRMVTLDAVQIPRSIWPKLGEHTDRRNQETLEFRNLLSSNGEEFKVTLIG